MELLILANGDPEGRRSCSGSARSLVDALRRLGHRVRSGDVDLHGLRRKVAAGLTFASDFRRWRARYHLMGLPFELRSRRAAAQIEAHRESLDLILLLGATFRPLGHEKIPYAVYADSNIRVSERNRHSGHTDAVALHPREVDQIAAREAEVYRQATAIFTLSETLRESFIADFGIPPHRVHTVHAGPNLDLGAVPDPRRRGPLLGPPTVLFVGRDFQRKGGPVLVEAMRRVRRSLPGARLLIAGPADVRVDEPETKMLGFLDQDTPEGRCALRQAYARADVFCLPTRFEPFGIVFLEAMAHGLPCVGPDAWAVPELVVEGETGHLVPVDDVERLAKRLLGLLSDRPLARRMGLAGRERLEAHFTWPKVAARMMETLAPQRMLVSAEALSGLPAAEPSSARQGRAAPGQRLPGLPRPQEQVSSSL